MAKKLRTAISIARLVSAGESVSGRAEARDLLLSTRAKFACVETSRDLREADDLVRVLNYVSPSGPKQTWRYVTLMSAFGGRTDISLADRDFRF